MQWQWVYSFVYITALDILVCWTDFLLLINNLDCSQVLCDRPH